MLKHRETINYSLKINIHRMVIFAEPLIKFSVNKINKMFKKLFAIFLLFQNKVIKYFSQL